MSTTRRTTRRSPLLGGLALVTATATLAACGPGGGGAAGGDGPTDFTTAPTGELAAWAFDNADDVGEARMAYAEEQLGDVEITMDQTSFDAQKFTTRVAGGQVPDVVQMDRRFVPTYAAQGLIQPLDACYDAHGVVADERFYDFVVDDVQWDDQLWAVPQFYQPPAILLNTRVLEAAGITDEQIDTSQPDVLLQAIAATYTEEGGSPTRLGLDPVAAGQAGLWVLGMGGQLTDEDGVPTLDDPSNVAGVELLKQITDAQGGYAQVKSFTDAFDTFGDANQYATDQVAAQVNAQWYPNVLSPYVGDVQVRAVPFLDAEGQPFSVAGGTAFVVPAGAKNPDAACAWMLELTEIGAWEAAGEARAATREEDGGINTGLFTGSPDADQLVRDRWVVESGDPGFDQVIATYYEVLDYGKTFGASPAGQEIGNALNNAVTAVLLGDATAEEALADAQHAAQRAYDNVTAAG
ncbi:extracellular solute-binding protein [Cellulomonas shaoxiangyii]|uniref:Extracellular solute-binding protein n=1 Tax=Cellulomonas shaoxiangyii TaxID=2566013 RepID=A0A4P7SLM3_9CELL|nr:extracellular solute-binding protein [Cellulomonas shaoxiangyii]QCB93714.1 extracellular solute-binding protein [Cellulomonas shaoxiangyii]TGY80111.1 extracellular solute-binding protein [Cellulomonas shaoxiangyii]